MKNLLFIIAIVLFISCSENSDGIELSPNSTVIENDCSYSNNGLLHNQGLDDILASYIKKDSWSYSEIFDSLKVFVKNQRSMINSGGGYNLTEFDMDTIVENMEAVLPYIVDNETDSISKYMISNGVPFDLVEQLKAVSIILNNNYESFESGMNAIVEFETTTDNEGKMSPILQESISLLKSSLCYWNDNANRWSEINYIGVQTRGFWDTVNGMAESDFWSMAVVTAVTFNPGAGVAAGCYGSAAKGIKDLVTGACC